MTEVRDYLAVITTDLGGGSFARGSDRTDVIKRAARFFRQDWKDYFKVKKGVTIKVNVVDVTGIDEVWWDCRGFWVGKKPLDRKVDLETYTY